MSRAIVWRVEHYKDGDNTILYSGGWEKPYTEDLIVADNESHVRQIWRSQHPDKRFTIGRITRITPLFKDEVDELIDHAKFMGMTNETLLEVLRGINSRLP